MVFVQAFIMGAALSAVTQLALMLAKVEPPKILMVCLVLGGFLSAFGVMDAMSAWGGGGFATSTFGAGNAIFAAAATAAGGSFFMAGVVVLLFVLLVSMTCLIGEAKFRMAGETEAGSSE